MALAMLTRAVIRRRPPPITARRRFHGFKPQISPPNPSVPAGMNSRMVHTGSLGIDVANSDAMQVKRPFVASGRVADALGGLAASASRAPNLAGRM